jgi:hypothetical protein
VAFGDEFRNVSSDSSQFNALGASMGSAKEDNATSIGADMSVLPIFVSVKQCLQRSVHAFSNPGLSSNVLA